MATIGKANYHMRKWRSPDGTEKESWELTCWITYSDGHHERYRKSGHANKGAADHWYKTIQKQVLSDDFEKPKRPPAPTLAAFCERFHAEGSIGKRPRSIVQDRLAAKWFRESVGDQTPLDQITSHDIDRFMHKRESAGRAEATVRRELTAIRRLFNVAVRWGILDKNPTDLTKKPVVPEGDVVFLEPEDQARLVSACTLLDDEAKQHSSSNAPYLRPLVALALQTGLRKGELLNLRWESLDLERRTLIVKNTANFRTKSKRNRHLNLTPAAIRELQAWRDWFDAEIGRAMKRAADPKITPTLREKAGSRLEILRRCEPRPERLVFPSFRNTGPDGEALPMDNLKKSFSTAIKQAFGDDEGNVPDRYKVGLHALRHSFAVMLARAGAPLIHISKALGHADLQTTQVYLRFAPDEGADVTRLLSDPTRPSAAILPHGTKPAEGREDDIRANA